MNDKTSGSRCMRRTGGLAAAAAVAVITTACASGSAPSPASALLSASAPTYAQELALAQCMRGHGVPSFPDPDSPGGFTLTSSGSIEGAGGSSIDINSRQAQAAYGECRHVLPGGPSFSQLERDVRQAQQQQARALPALLTWARCVRSHGEPSFNLGLGGQAAADGSGGAISHGSPQLKAALTACHHLLPPGVHVSVSKNMPAS